MALTLPPIPPDPIGENPTWRNWLLRMRETIVTKATFLFTSLDFTSSNLTSIVTRNHNDLQSFQGGTTSQYYHLTSAEHTSLQTSLGTGGLATSGYTYLPNGMIMQWGTTGVIASTAAGVAVSFNINFPTACVYVNCIGTATRSSTSEANTTITAHSTTGFSLASGNGTSQAFLWFAIGY